MTDGLPDVVTVGDRVRLTKDLIGVVRFVGEIHARKGTYYGIELNEGKGKSNGVVGNIRYFKCKAKRGLFLRYARIQEVVASESIPRIGIGDFISLYVNGSRKKCIAQVRYIGIPNRCTDVYYGVQLHNKKSVGDSDGFFRGTRYFTVDKNCAHFLKCSSSHIKKVQKSQSTKSSSKRSHPRSHHSASSSSSDNDTTDNSRQNNSRQNSSGSNYSNGGGGGGGGRSNKSASTHASLHNGNSNSTNNNNSNHSNATPSASASTKSIEVPMYMEDHPLNTNSSSAPLFHIHLPSDFNFAQLSAKIGEMSQYVSTIFEIKFRQHSHSRQKLNGFTDTDILLNEHEFNVLKSHSNKSHFHEYGRFLIAEPLKRGVLFEEQGMHSEALGIYERALDSAPKSTEALTYYANCLVLLSKLDLAETFYEKALKLNPFAGDICYFYSRLLEFRAKFEEGQVLCREIINYAKKSKSMAPPKHHQIHYSCYARLSDKYLQMSLDKTNRQKQSVRQSLEQYNNEKNELQHQIQTLEKDLQMSKQLQQRNGGGGGGGGGSSHHIEQQMAELKSEKKQHLLTVSQLNAKIERMEFEYAKQENILQRKEHELISKEKEISQLRHELSVAKKDSNISGAKLLSQKILTDANMTGAAASASATTGSATKQSTKGGKKKKSHQKKLKGNEPLHAFDGYTTKLGQIREQKAQYRERMTRLKEELLHCERMKSLNNVTESTERQSLMKSKLELCVVICNFECMKEKLKAESAENEDAEEAQSSASASASAKPAVMTMEKKNEMSRIDNKKDVLLEVLQCMSGNKWNSIELLAQCIETIWSNLFRSLPDESMIRTDPNDDEMDFRDPAWDHLQLIYELTFHVVTNTHIDKKTMKKQLQGAFLENLIHLFSSCDDREPQYVKIIVHAIYGRFMALRKAIRRHLSNYCYKYIYTSTFRDSSSWQGLPEILEIFCSVFQGLNVPVKPDYHIVLRNVIVPLHKSFHLDEFHEQLLQCCTQFVTKDPLSAPVILGGILKFWPKFSPLKEQLFITQIVHILNVCIRHPNIKQSDPSFASITIAVLERFVHCMVSTHHQVAERSLMVWRDETVRICVDLHREKIWPKIYAALQKNKESYWLSAIRNINRQIMSDFKRRDPEFFEKIEKQQQQKDENFNNNNKLSNNNERQLTQREQREMRWIQLKRSKRILMSFNKKYMFQSTQIVIVQHKENEFFRVRPGALAEVCTHGGRGPYAQWEMEPILSSNHLKCKLKSTKTGKYLRVQKSGEINVEGNGGKLTVFRVHKYGDAVNQVKLQSNVHPDNWLAVKKNGQIKNGNGGHRCELVIYRN